MMTETNLKEILKTLFSIDDEHLVQLQRTSLFKKLSPGQMKIQLVTKCNQNQSEKKREENISEQISDYHLLENMRKNFLRKFYYGSVIKNIMFILTILECQFFLYPIKDRNKIAWIVDLSTNLFLNQEQII